MAAGPAALAIGTEATLLAGAGITGLAVAGHGHQPVVEGGAMLTRMPLDHIGINVPDVAVAQEYYDALMPLVDFKPFMSGADWFSYGPVRGNGTQLFFYTAQEGGSYSRDRPGLQHLCFLVKTRAAVHAAYEWALERGNEVLHEPQTFPQYHPDHYAVFWVDPHGFKIEVVSFGPSE